VSSSGRRLRPWQQAWAPDYLGRILAEVIEDVARLGARLIIQSTLDAEVAVFLGRARYQRAAGVEGAARGHDGYCPATVKTTAGPVTVARPKLRGTTEAFASRLFGKGITKSNALESLVAWLALFDAQPGPGDLCMGP
jgi:putative transposase